MIDVRFSSQAFASAELDSDEARILADQLADEITDHLAPLLNEKLAEIAAQLNAMGHNLRLYDDSEQGAISYRDDFQMGTQYVCRLRLALDVVVSTGYSHLLDPDNI